MSDFSSIEWTNTTWNPTLGCTRVSPGCNGCYAIPSARMRASHPNPKIAAAYAGLTERTPDRVDWTGRVNLLEERLTQPLRWREPRRVFVDSMSDLFHDQVPVEFIARVFAVMALTPQHTYQLLTKRHGRMRSILRDECRCGSGHVPSIHLRSAMAWAVSKANPDRIPGAPDDAERRVYFEAGWPLGNVWLGVSVEDQPRADLRIPALLETPAAVRFLSCEPLLGPVDLFGPIVPERGRPRLTYWLDGRPGWGPEQTTETGLIVQEPTVGPRIDWVIVGGESGRDATPMHPNWVRSLRDQCQAADVPFFFKQWGEWGPAPFVVRVCDSKVGWQGTEEQLEAAKRDAEARGATHVHTGNPYRTDDGQTAYYVHEMDHKPWSLERAELPDVHLAPIRRWGKKAAGRTLDGQTWDQYPAARHPDVRWT